MKTIKSIFILFLISFIGNYNVSAQETASVNKPIQVEIKTSAVCDMCKKSIEKALFKVKGVKTAELEVETAKAVVLYDPRITNLDKIRRAISNIGYDADEVLADPDAYANLDGCCKKGSKCDD